MFEIGIGFFFFFPLGRVGRGINTSHPIFWHVCRKEGEGARRRIMDMASKCRRVCRIHIDSRIYTTPDRKCILDDRRM